MKKVLLVVGIGVGAWVLFRAVRAHASGGSVVAALTHPTLSPALADLAAHPERQQARRGAAHFV